LQLGTNKIGFPPMGHETQIDVTSAGHGDATATPAPHASIVETPAE
jgi:hypothetical protein